MSWDDKNGLRNLRRRVNRARRFPENTCPWSRHLHLMAEQLAEGKPYPMLQEEPEHCAWAMLVVLEELFKLRTASPDYAAKVAKQLRQLQERHAQDNSK